MIRSTAFFVAYWLITAIYVILALPMLALPGGLLKAWIRSYTRSMRFALRLFAGVKVAVRGKEHLPEGSFIIAAKHQSWGDGFLIYPEVDGLTFVTGDHLEKFPFVKGILRKLGAIVIDTCGGGEKKASSLADGVARLEKEQVRVLIYPEGHLAPTGHHFKYKSGVWHMSNNLELPIVPVATNLGVYWSQEDFRKQPGTAVLQFLPPIAAGTSKSETMERLTREIETASSELLAEALGKEPVPTVLLPDPQKGTLAKPKTPEALV